MSTHRLFTISTACIRKPLRINEPGHFEAAEIDAANLAFNKRVVIGDRNTKPLAGQKTVQRESSPLVDSDDNFIDDQSARQLVNRVFANGNGIAQFRRTNLGVFLR